MKKKMSNRDKTFWAVVIPVVILFFAFNTLPMIKGVIYSFTNYKGYGTYDYVGFRNYADLFTDSRVGKSYLFTFKYALAAPLRGARRRSGNSSANGCRASPARPSMRAPGRSSATGA